MYVRCCEVDEMITTSWKKKRELFNKYVNELPNDAVKINLGAGNMEIKGFIKADCFGDKYEIFCDLNKEPYPFKDNSVDFVLINHALEHIKEPELFWVEMARILKPLGKVFVSVPHKDAHSAYSTFGHRNFFHEDCIDSITEDRPSDPSIQNNWKLINKLVSRGKYMKWQKREILWVVEKNE